MALNTKKELLAHGYQAEKTSMKAQTALFTKKEGL